MSQEDGKLEVGKSNPLPSSRCPNCRSVSDCASPMFSKQVHRPRPGDFSLCAHCATLLVFDENLKLREPTEKETASIESAFEKHPEVGKSIRHVQTLIERKIHNN